jgi:hypothetical protein
MPIENNEPNQINIMGPNVFPSNQIKSNQLHFLVKPILDVPHC